MNAPRPIAVVIAAMGGEGGGVLTDWLVQAATDEGLAVQSTSIPGVAQRTGATTYYVEIHPVPLAQLGSARPILGLAPSTGDVDLIVATELMEAARSVAKGFADFDRTRLIASTHRVYAVTEKTAMGDGRVDGERLTRVIRAGVRAPLLFDMEQAARQAGSIINSVMLGAIAGSGALPIRPETFEAGIRASGKAVDSNLRGFQAGLAMARGEAMPAPQPPSGHRHPRMDTALALEARANAELPEPARDPAIEAVRRLTAYQDARYAQTYLERLAKVASSERGAGGDGSVTRSVARHLAVRMAFDDVIRVAQLKTDPGRLARIRTELGAQPGQPVVIRDFLKPGIDEICGILPAPLARPILALARRNGWMDTAFFGAEVATSGILGNRLLRLVAGLRAWRRMSYRYGEEQRFIDEWLAAVVQGLSVSPALGLEVSECARLIKGYGETWQRGQSRFRRIREAVIGPAVSGRWAAGFAVDALASARAAALADPDGQQLERTLAAIAAKSG